MLEFYDDNESRPPELREREIYSKLPDLITRATHAPGWADQLTGVNPASVTSRAVLAVLPVLRKSNLKERQLASPPFGGFIVTPADRLKRLLMSPGPIFEPEGHGTDWWNAARALFAAGFRRGDVVHNAFAYHLTPGGFILESGAHALGCTVIPGGVGNTEQQVEAIAHLNPNGYTGSGAALPPSLRTEFDARGVAVLQAYATAELGVIAYETAARDGMVVNENIIVEIVRPGTGDPVGDGEVGEVVVTSFNADYPMIRLATGDLSAVLAGPSPCGRTNMRINGWMGRADQTTKIKGMFVHPGQVVEVAKRHPELGRVRLRVTREAEQDVMTLAAECAVPASGVEGAVAASLQAVTKLKGRVQLIAPGTLPNDGKIIADERS